MSRFYFETLATSVGLDFKNFDDMPPGGDLSPLDKTENTDLDISLYKDTGSKCITNIEKSRFANCVKKTENGSYCTLFDAKNRKTFCFFEENVDLHYIVDYAVNRSFLAFQSLLDIVFLHAASVMDDGKAYLFIAPSGGGKTTICSLAEEMGIKVLNDEICVVKKGEDGFLAGELPSFFDVQDNLGIEAIFFLEKSRINRVEELSTVEAIRRTLPQATCFHYGHVPGREKVSYRKHVFKFLNTLFQDVDFGLLKFNKNTDVFLCLNLMKQ